MSAEVAPSVAASEWSSAASTTSVRIGALGEEAIARFRHSTPPGEAGPSWTPEHELAEAIAGLKDNYDYNAKRVLKAHNIVDRAGVLAFDRHSVQDRDRRAIKLLQEAFGAEDDDGGAAAARVQRRRTTEPERLVATTMTPTPAQNDASPVPHRLTHAMPPPRAAMRASPMPPPRAPDAAEPDGRKKRRGVPQIIVNLLSRSSTGIEKEMLVRRVVRESGKDERYVRDQLQRHDVSSSNRLSGKKWQADSSGVYTLPAEARARSDARVASGTATAPIIMQTPLQDIMERCSGYCIACAKPSPSTDQAMVFFCDGCDCEIHAQCTGHDFEAVESGKLFCSRECYRYTTNPKPLGGSGRGSPSNQNEVLVETVHQLAIAADLNKNELQVLVCRIGENPGKTPASKQCYDEVFYVVRGQIEIAVLGGKATVRAGQRAIVPKNTERVLEFKDATDWLYATTKTALDQTQHAEPSMMRMVLKDVLEREEKVIEKVVDDLTAALNERDEAKAKNDECDALIAAANDDRDSAIRARDQERRAAAADNAALRTQLQALQNQNQALQNQMTATIAQNTALKRKAEAIATAAGKAEEAIKSIKSDSTSI